jgi:FAD:protein FMN transferase
MQKWSYNIIGTHLGIAIDTTEDCSTLFSEIETRLQQFETKFSRFIEGNWLHELNISRRGILDDDAREMLGYALEIARRTDGYFDPTVGKRLTELGYWNKAINSEESVSVIPAEAGINASKNWNYKDIEVVWDEVILHWDILLEFGWVGKGYLIDVIKDIITSGTNIYSDTRYLINFWWDMYGRRGWKVGLESPFASDEVIGTHILDDGFLACSAGTKRRWWDGKHHLIDPHTGESAREVVASYIEGSSGISVDSYATALCVMPWERAVDTLQKTPEISGVIVKYDGTLFQKEGSKSELFS